MKRTSPLWVSVLSMALACSADGTEPEPAGTIRFVAGAGGTDTVDAEPAQALVAEIRGVPPGTVVLFESPSTLAPKMLLSPLGSNQFGVHVADTTDGNGRVGARLKFGFLAGEAHVRIVVPEYGESDSTKFTITPGNLARLHGAPNDTSVRPGASFTLRAIPRDRLGNPRSDPVMATVLNGDIALAGLSATALSTGRARIQLLAEGALPVGDTVTVNVVPDGILAATAVSSLLVLRTDGTVLQTIPLPSGPAITADWSPNGSEVALDGGEQTPTARIRLVTMAGQIRRPTSLESSFDYYPEYSADGAWLYYSAFANQTWTVRRVRPDGTGDTVVIAKTGLDVAASPAPDGSRIAYVVTGIDELMLYTVATNSSVSLALPGHSPAWSPAGDRIAFVANGQIHVINPDGTNSRQLTFFADYRLGLDWSPDQEWIVAATTSGTIHIIDAETGEVLRVQTPSLLSAPTWRPD